ncbi:MAG: DoxX family protein [Myxococcaceae bacterium]
METTAGAVDTSSRKLHIGLWVAQGLLALAFLGSGFMKVMTPFAELIQNPMMGWATQVGPNVVKLAGTSEIFGALGLILPGLTRKSPKLTTWAALGLLTIMVLAAGLHLSRGESPLPNVILGGLAAFVAWGRSMKVPLLGRR